MAVYDPSETYKLSRSGLEDFIQCKGCFWLKRSQGVRWPDGPGWPLNSATDTLLKRDADRYRGMQAHPIMVKAGFDNIRPYQHEDLSLWTNSLHFAKNDHYFNYHDKKTDIIFGGGVDDVFEHTETGQLYVVDYKSTSKQESKPLIDDTYGLAYQRQADMYTHVAKKRGMKVGDTAFFIFVNGLKDETEVNGMMDPRDPGISWMKFRTTVIEYRVKQNWVERALEEAKEVLEMLKSPPHEDGCTWWRWYEGVQEAM